MSPRQRKCCCTMAVDYSVRGATRPAFESSDHPPACATKSGQSEPRQHITREGGSYLRMVLVQEAQRTLSPFREDSDLRRWGLKLESLSSVLPLRDALSLRFAQ